MNVVKMSLGNRRVKFASRYAQPFGSQGRKCVGIIGHQQQLCSLVLNRGLVCCNYKHFCLLVSIYQNLLKMKIKTVLSDEFIECAWLNLFNKCGLYSYFLQFCSCCWSYCLYMTIHAVDRNNDYNSQTINGNSWLSDWLIFWPPPMRTRCCYMLC